MKKSFLAALVLLASLGASQAQAFQVLPYVTYVGYEATATITNPYLAPMSCFGTIYGYRSDGNTQWMNYNFFLLPGGSQYAYLYSGGYFGFLGASSVAECWFN